MAGPEQILCLDIGCSTIKAAEYSYTINGEMLLDSFAFLDYYSSEEEQQTEEENSSNTAREKLGDALRKIVTENGFKAKKLYVSLSGKDSYIRFVKLPAMVEDERKLRQIVEYEARSSIPFDLDDVVWDSQLIRKDDENGEIEAMYVIIKADEVDYITNTLESLGKEVMLIEVAPTAIYNAARVGGIGEEHCEMILNIGNRCSLLVFVDKGRFFARPIPIAGYTITHQISKEFGISFADAEEMKRKHGFVALGGAYEEPDSEVATVISKIVRNVMTRLHGEISRSINIYRSQQEGRKPEKLYLAGGSSVLPYTPRFFEEKLRIPTEYFNAFQKIAIKDTVDKELLAELAPSFPETVGLAVRHATACPLEVSLIPTAIRRHNDFKGRKPYFYASAVSFLLIALISFFSFSVQKGIAAKKLDIADRKLKTIKRVADKVKGAQGNFNNSRGEYEEAENLLKNRSKWPETLSKIQNVLPEGLWLSSFSFGLLQQTQTQAPRRRRSQEMEMNFGEIAPEAAAPKEPSTFNAVNFEAHYLKKDYDLMGEFFASLKNSDLFEFNPNTDQNKVVQKNSGVGPYNIASFNISVKLKNSVER